MGLRCALSWIALCLRREKIKIPWGLKKGTQITAQLVFSPEVRASGGGFWPSVQTPTWQAPTDQLLTPAAPLPQDPPFDPDDPGPKPGFLRLTVIQEGGFLGDEKKDVFVGGVITTTGTDNVVVVKLRARPKPASALALSPTPSASRYRARSR